MPRIAVVAAVGLLIGAIPACSLRVGYDEVAPDAGADGDAGMGGPDAGATLAAPCGSLGLLRDGFDDGATDPQWIASAAPGVSLDETAGHLAVALGAGTADVEASYRSRHAYDLRDSALAVTVLRAAGQHVAIEVRDPDGRGGALAVRASTLVALALAGDQGTERAQVAYDPARHRHWRLREASGLLHWETSADRATWSVLHAEPLAITGALVHGHLVARGQIAAGGETWFADVNLPAASMPGFCPAGSFSDTFDDGVVAPLYNNWTDGDSCGGRETGGVIELSFAGSGDAWCGVETRQVLDLRESAVVVEAPTTPGYSTAMAFFEAVTADGDKIQIGRGPDGMFAEMTGSARQLAWRAVPYDPALHRFWRLRESGGQTYWDVSADGIAWSNHLAAPTAIDLGAVIIDIAAGHWRPGPGTPFTVRYDQLGVAP